MDTFIRITKTSREVEFRRGKLLQVGKSGRNLYVVSEGEKYYGDGLVQLTNEIINRGGDCVAYVFDNAIHSCYRCRRSTDSSKFEEGKFYMVNVENYNLDMENPFRYCIEGMELMNSDFETMPTYYTDPQTLFVSIVTALGDQSTFTTASFESYLENTLPKLESEFQAKRFDPYILTDEERETLKEKIIETLKTYNHPYTKNGVDDILDEWISNKGELITAFMSHPNYNGNFQIVFSNEVYAESINKRAGAYFTDWIYSNYNFDNLLVKAKLFGRTRSEWQRERSYLTATMPLVVPMVNGDEMELVNYDLYKSRREAIDKITFILQLMTQEYTQESVDARNTAGTLVDEIRRYRSDRVDEQLAKNVNRCMPEIRAREGQKTTKVVGKIMKHYGIDKISDYTKAYAKYCDQINTIRTTRHTVLSLHPMDYLTMSFGNSWSSCHTIDKDNIRNRPGDGYRGAYCSGTLSYMLDATSFVLYTVKSDYTGNTFYEQDKISRCMFHVGKEKIVQGRCYPQSDDGNSEIYTQLRNLVQKTMADIWGIPNMWKIQRDNLEYMIRAKGTNYRDFFHYSGCNISKFKYSEAEIADEVIVIGHDPICPVCGDEHGEEQYLSCCDEGEENEVYCPVCGDRVGFGESIEYDGVVYHEECGFYCEYHNRWEPNSETHYYVQSYGNVCEDAVRYTDSFFRCDCCDEYYHADELRWVVNNDNMEITVCEACSDNYFTNIDGTYYDNDLVTTCEECGAYCLIENTTETDSGDICARCAEERSGLEEVV